MWNFYKSVENKLDSKVPRFSASASGSVSQAEISMIIHAMKSCVQPRRYYKTMVPECIKNNVANYVLIYGTEAAIDKLGKKYPKYTFVQK